MVPQILEALPLAAAGGLSIPLVYNTSAYDALETLQLLDGVVDIYMPDTKFWDPAVAGACCQAPEYPAVARLALAEMHRQVGDLVLDARGVALHGVLVRHLVLPDGLAGTGPWLDFLHRELSPGTYVNLMDQYRPCHRATEMPGLDRPITPQEYRAAKALAARAGITRLDDAEGSRTMARLFSLLAADDPS